MWRAPRPALQPRKPAFSIWGLIFPLLLAGAAFVPARAVLPLWLALVCASAWGLAFRARAWRAAAGCLAAAAALAWTATILAPLEATLYATRERHIAAARARERRSWTATPF